MKTETFYIVFKFGAFECTSESSSHVPGGSVCFSRAPNKFEAGALFLFFFAVPQLSLLTFVLKVMREVMRIWFSPYARQSCVHGPSHARSDAQTFVFEKVMREVMRTQFFHHARYFLQRTTL